MGHSPVPELCPRFHRASELIGRRWTGAIIFVLLKRRCRFAALRAAIPEITDRMLSERLQEMEQEGIVERTVVPETPVRVEYELTRKGRALASAIDAIAHWAEKWVTVDEPAPGGQAQPATRAAAARSGGRGPATTTRRPRKPSGRTSA
jgi:DNA-binding HxlR family transcriptional regulator